MTRTTIDLDPSVLRRLREQSRDQGKSMGQLASEILMYALAADAYPFRWTSRDLGHPKVDLEDKEAVRAIIDAR